MDISDGLAAYLNEFGANQPLTVPVRALETASQVSCQIIPFPRLACPSANHLAQADPAPSLPFSLGANQTQNEGADAKPPV
jgi:hypothetical protein